MQFFAPAYPRCKNRLARPRLISTWQLGLWMATATTVVWSTTACCSLFGSQPNSPTVGPARREQPRHADGARARLHQPPGATKTHRSAARTIILRPIRVTASPTNRTSSSAIGSQARIARVAVENTNVPSLGHAGGQWVAQKNDLPDPDDKAEAVAPPASGRPAQSKAKDDSQSEDKQEAGSCFTAAPLSTVRSSIALPAGKLPESAYARCADQTLPTGDPRLTGGWAVTDYHWSATCMRHRPLYFEEVNAERYGYTPSYLLQPLFSAGRFFATIPALPYKMAVDCPCDCVYTLGHYRPGSCNPWRPHRLPVRLGASLVEVGAIAGLILILP